MLTLAAKRERMPVPQPMSRTILSFARWSVCVMACWYVLVRTLSLSISSWIPSNFNKQLLACWSAAVIQNCRSYVVIAVTTMYDVTLVLTLTYLSRPDLSVYSCKTNFLRLEDKLKYQYLSVIPLVVQVLHFLLGNIIQWFAGIHHIALWNLE